MGKTHVLFAKGTRVMLTSPLANKNTLIPVAKASKHGDVEHFILKRPGLICC